MIIQEVQTVSQSAEKSERVLIQYQIAGAETAQTFPMLKQELELGTIEKDQALPKGDPFLTLTMTEEDKQTISDMISTLANANMLALGFKSGKLEAQGDSISHVHTLKYIEYILTDPATHANFIKMRNRSPQKIWNTYADRTGAALAKLNAEGKIKPYLPGFCKAVGVKQSALEPFVKKNDWVGFLNYLNPAQP